MKTESQYYINYVTQCCYNSVLYQDDHS